MKGMLWAVVDREAVLALAPARFEVVYADHLTLQFRVGKERFQRWIGKAFTAPVTAEAWDGDIQALRIALPEAVRSLCEKEHPHITVSARKGVSPKQSNDLLDDPESEQPLAAELAFRIVWRPFG